MLALLGWNPGTTQEIFTLDELVEAFSLDRVSKSGAKFDPEKTKWFQQQYLRAQSDEEIALKLQEISENEYDLETLKAVTHLMKERATFAQDILTDGAYLLDKPHFYDRETISKKWKPETAQVIQEWKNELAHIADFNSANVESAFKAFLERKQMGIGAVLLPFRLAVTGVGAGPGMFDISAFLGKDEVIARIELGLKKITEILHES
jgi:glutamyl-tRNA synthetase